MQIVLWWQARSTIHFLIVLMAGSVEAQSTSTAEWLMLRSRCELRCFVSFCAKHKREGRLCTDPRYGCCGTIDFGTNRQLCQGLQSLRGLGQTFIDGELLCCNLQVAALTASEWQLSPGLQPSAGDGTGSN